MYQPRRGDALTAEQYERLTEDGRYRSDAIDGGDLLPGLQLRLDSFLQAYR